MAKKILFFITADAFLREQIELALTEDFEARFFSTKEEAFSAVLEKFPDLLVIDTDTPKVDALAVYRKFRVKNERLRCVILTTEGNIALAVKATKMGVREVLRKPLDVDLFKRIIHVLLSMEDDSIDISRSLALDTEWLYGTSEEIRKLFSDLQMVLKETRDLFIIGESGINKYSLAEVIHHSLFKNRKLVRLALPGLGQETQEMHFWSLLREFLKESPEKNVSDEEVCGTIILDGIEQTESHFQVGLMDFLSSRNNSEDEYKFDRTTRVLLPISNISLLSDFVPQKTKDWFSQIHLPVLRQRKQDLPFLISEYLRKFSIEYSKDIKGISFEALDYLVSYDFPGNYEELKQMLRRAVLVAEDPYIQLKDIVIDFSILLQVSKKKIQMQGQFSFEKIKSVFEDNLFTVIFEKTGRDVAKSARFLDIPRDAFSDKLGQ